jgi:hypothetical protein
MLFLQGLFSGAVVSQRPVVVTDIVGVEKLPSSFGMTVFCQGVLILVGSAIAGERSYTLC